MGWETNIVRGSGATLGYIVGGMSGARIGSTVAEGLLHARNGWKEMVRNKNTRTTVVGSAPYRKRVTGSGPGRITGTLPGRVTGSRPGRYIRRSRQKNYPAWL